MSSRTTQTVISLLEGAKRSGPGWKASCPAHEDRTPSLSVSEGQDGRVLLKCHAGCSQNAVISALGILPKDLFPAKGNGIANGPGRGSSIGEIRAVYDYKDEDGKLLFQTVRYSTSSGGKSFRQRRPDPDGGWIWNLRGVPRTLFRLPELLEGIAAGELVHLCEGEKDVLAAVQAGGVATCNPSGARKWEDGFSEILRDAHVLVWEDQDAAGRAHSTRVAESLTGIAASIEVVRPREGNDLSDHLEAGFGLQDGVRSETDPPVFMSLAEAQQHPELLRPPPTVISPFVLRNRHSILAGLPKDGKTTLVAHAAAALTRGGLWLGTPMLAPGRVVWLGCEEAPGDVVRRQTELDTDPERFRFLWARQPDLLESLRRLLDEWPADLVVVDSLAGFSRCVLGEIPADADTNGWGAIVRPLTDLAHSGRTSVLSNHHSRRDGRYRGGTEIFAGVDALFEFGKLPGPAANPNARHITGSGRWQIEPLTVCLTDGRFELAGGGVLPVDVRVLLHIEQYPGTNVRTIRAEVHGGSGAITAALADLEARGAIENRGNASRAAYFLASSSRAGGPT